MDIPKSDDETYGFTLYWRIENFDPEPSFDFIKSQVFKIYSMNSSWQVEIDVDDDKENLGAYLYKMSNTAPFLVHYSLSLLTGSGWTTIIKNEKERFKVGGDGYGEDFVSLETLKKEEWFYLPNGSLTICFHIWNDRIKTDCCQRLMISRLIDGDYLRHRPIQTFSTLKPSDLLAFPISYEFQSNAVSNVDLQHKVKDTQNDATFNFKDHQSTSATNVDLLTTKELKSQHTQTDTSYSLVDLQDDAATNVDLQKAKVVKTQHTQTDAKFKDLDDLRKLFKEKDFSFVTLQTPTKEFSVHKALLCAKSPVFNAMFERKMKENDSNVVEVDDIDNQTMDLFVKFVHFESLDELKWEAAVSLYYPADKYQIHSLKEHCVSLLKKELTVENVCDVLRLADLHQDSDLMSYAQEYFCKNSKIILLSPQWKEMLTNTELVAKLLCKLAGTLQ